MFADNSGIRIHWEEAGFGPAVLLIQGLGYPMGGWRRQVDALSGRFWVLTMDNRGCGLSDSPEEHYTVADMARDALAVLDEAGARRANVVGLSLGGLVAQELALTHPERVQTLALMGTFASSREYKQATDALWREILNIKGMTQEQAIRHGVSFAVAEGFPEAHPDVMDEIVRVRLEKPQSAIGFSNQFRAGGTHEAKERLPGLRIPTLVVTGTADRVVPPVFSREIAHLVPGARCEELEGVGHLSPVEAPERVGALLDGFFA